MLLNSLFYICFRTLFENRDKMNSDQEYHSDINQLSGQLSK